MALKATVLQLGTQIGRCSFPWEARIYTQPGPALSVRNPQGWVTGIL